jgi:RHS repeat-associated protein
VDYVYDLASKIKQVSDPTGVYGFAYDNMGRLVGTTTQYSFISGQTFSNAYVYDAASNRTSFTSPHGGTDTYAYDTLNQLTNITDSATGQFTFSYDALSRRTALNRPNGVNTNYAYNSLSRLLSVLHQTGAITLDGASYTYDNAGNRTAKTNSQNGITEQYSYDMLYQLTQVVQGATTTESYSFDAVGNRLSSAGMSPYAYNSSNQLTSTPAAMFTYDGNGNTLTKANSTGTTQYTWDFENRLSSAVLPAAGTVTFKYDAFGRRIQKSSASGTTNYLYDGSNSVEEVDQSGALLARYAQGAGIDEPLAESRGGTNGFYEQDGLGSVTSLTGSSGSLADTYTYNSFGVLTASSGSLTNPFQYIGRDYDAETGLRYYRARYYDPASGRFISEDPLQLESGDVNFYAYVWNNPINLVDPRGLRPGDRYPNLRCAGWHAIRDINITSRHRSPAWPNGREYGGWMYRNSDGTYSYAAPVAGGADGVQINQFNPVPAGAVPAGDYHTHGAYDPAFNGQGINPGQPGYNWHHDGNEVFSAPDMRSNEAEGAHGLPGFLGTPQGTTEEYIPIPGHPGAGHIVVLTPRNCGCQQQHHR